MMLILSGAPMVIVHATHFNGKNRGRWSVVIIHHSLKTLGWIEFTWWLPHHLLQQWRKIFLSLVWRHILIPQVGGQELAWHLASWVIFHMRTLIRKREFGELPTSLYKDKHTMLKLLVSSNLALEEMNNMDLKMQILPISMILLKTHPFSLSTLQSLKTKDMRQVYCQSTYLYTCPWFWLIRVLK